jgi:hypothetical protein
MWGMCAQCALRYGGEPSWVGKCEPDVIVSRPCLGCSRETLQPVYIDWLGRCVDGGCSEHAFTPLVPALTVDESR